MYISGVGRVVELSHERGQKVTNFIRLFQLIDTVDQLYL